MTQLEARLWLPIRRASQLFLEPRVDFINVDGSII